MTRAVKCRACLLVRPVAEMLECAWVAGPSVTFHVCRPSVHARCLASLPGADQVRIRLAVEPTPADREQLRRAWAERHAPHPEQAARRPWVGGIPTSVPVPKPKTPSRPLAPLP